MVKRILGAACGALIVGLCLAASASAIGTVNRTTYLTFSGDVALPGVKLAAGTYIFELASPGQSPSLVRVLSRDRSKIYLLAFTNFTPRPRSKTGRPRSSPRSLRTVPCRSSRTATARGARASSSRSTPESRRG